MTKLSDLKNASSDGQYEVFDNETGIIDVDLSKNTNIFISQGDGDLTINFSKNNQSRLFGDVIISPNYLYDLSFGANKNIDISHSFKTEVDLSFLPSDITYGMYIKPSGDTMLIQASGFIYQFTLSDPFNINSATYDEVSFDLNPFLSSTPLSIDVSNDGTTLIIVDRAEDGNIVQFNMSTPFDITTLSKSIEFSASYAWGACYSDNGNYLFITYGTEILRYNIPTPFDLSSIDTASLVTYTINRNISNTSRGIGFLNDGAYLVLADNDHRLSTVKLNSPYDLSNIEWNQNRIIYNGRGLYNLYVINDLIFVVDYYKTISAYSPKEKRSYNVNVFGEYVRVQEN